MHFDLAKNFTYCIADGRAVLLDLERDRYFALPDELDATFQRFASRAPVGTLDQDQAEALVGIGVLIPSATPHPLISPRNKISPVCLELPRSQGRPSPSLAARALISEIGAGRALRRGQLRDIGRLLDHARDRAKAASPQRKAHRITDIGDAFRFTSLILSSHDRCLVKSLAFARLCIDLGHEVSVVIGVITSPFGAHCWVQRGECVLNDSVERVRPFSPILVI